MELPLYFIENLVAIAAVILAMIALYASARATGQPQALIDPSVEPAFWFFFATFSLVFLLYVVDLFGDGLAGPREEYSFANLLDPFYLALGSEGASTGCDAGPMHAALHIVRSALGDSASLTLLGTAVAYCGGAAFKIRNALLYSFLAFVLFVLWAVLMEVAHHSHSMFATVLEFAPGVVLASIATVALGWAVYVRWGGLAGGVYLVLTFIYALLQMPANLLTGLSCFAETDQSETHLTFAMLAGGKIFLSFGFLALLSNSTAPYVDMKDARYWPGTAVEPPPWVYGGAIAGAVSSILPHVLAIVIGEEYIRPLYH